MAYEVQYTVEALRAIESISDRRVQSIIQRRAGRLAEEPFRQGKLLQDELVGYRTVRAAGQRYRIIYYVDQTDERVIVINVGIRKAGSRRDVYFITVKLIRLGLIDPSI